MWPYNDFSIFYVDKLCFKRSNSLNCKMSFISSGGQMLEAVAKMIRICDSTFSIVSTTLF